MVLLELDNIVVVSEPEFLYLALAELLVILAEELRSLPQLWVRLKGELVDVAVGD